MKVVAKTLLVFLVLVLSTGGMALAQQQNAPADQKESGKKMVNINTASQAELETLPGIGPSLAKKILDFRQKNGNFKTSADITAVQGIGDRKYEQLKNLITVK